MVSRDTKLQAGAVAVGVGLIFTWAYLEGGPGPVNEGLSILDSLFGFGITFVIVAGVHLFLATRGEGGELPADARWRFVIVAAVSLVLFALAAFLTEADAIAGLRPELPVYGVLGALLLGYFVFEAREGYLERKPE